MTRRVQVARRSGDAWVIVARRWAAMVPVAATAPGVEGEALVARGRWWVAMRTDADVRLGDRLRWAGPELAVLRVTRDPATPSEVTISGEEREDG